MERLVIEKSLKELHYLNSQKQFNLAERKARILFQNINPESKDEYPFFVQIVNLLAEILSRSAKNLNAVELLETTIKKYPFEKSFYQKLYEINIKLKRLAQAENLLKYINVSDPGSFSDGLNLVKFAISRKNNLMAIGEINKLLAAEFFQPDLYRLLITLYQEEGLFSEKLEALRSLLRFYPEDAALLKEEISTCFQLKLFSTAFSLLENTLATKLEKNEFDFLFCDLLLNFGVEFLHYGFVSDFALYITPLFKNYLKLEPARQKQIDQIAHKYDLALLSDYFTGKKIISADPQKLNKLIPYLKSLEPSDLNKISELVPEYLRLYFYLPKES